jgi:hypothetical protein
MLKIYFEICKTLLMRSQPVSQIIRLREIQQSLLGQRNFIYPSVVRFSSERGCPNRGSVPAQSLWILVR